MEKAIFFIGLGISFILFPAIALIFCSILKHRPTKIECLYMGIHCLGGLASIMAGIFFMGKFIR
ncbi:hypothetical protein II906_02380 [bacterium]|nr:hypothetical protein [bacterium]